MHLELATSAPVTQIAAQDLICPVCMSKHHCSIFKSLLLTFILKIAIDEDPHVTSCCNRVFCSKDANPSKYDNGCPLCREVNYSFQQSPKHKSMLDQLTIKCACSERIAPLEHEYHMARCSSVTFVCPHIACREKVSH